MEGIWHLVFFQNRRKWHDSRLLSNIDWTPSVNFETYRMCKLFQALSLSSDMSLRTLAHINNDLINFRESAGLCLKVKWTALLYWRLIRRLWVHSLWVAWPLISSNLTPLGLPYVFVSLASDEFEEHCAFSTFPYTECPTVSCGWALYMYINRSCSLAGQVLFQIAIISG